MIKKLFLTSQSIRNITLQKICLLNTLIRKTLWESYDNFLKYHKGVDPKTIYINAKLNQPSGSRVK